MAASSLLLFVLGSNSISVGLLWSPLQREQQRAAESQQSYSALRRSREANQRGSSFIAKSVNEDRTKTNSIYDEALQKSNTVEIFGISADTSWFWFSFKRENSHKKK